MSINEIQPEDTSQALVSAITPFCLTAIRLGILYLASSLIKAPVAEAVQSCKEGSKEVGGGLISELEKRYLKYLKDVKDIKIRDVNKKNQRKEELARGFVGDFLHDLEPNFNQEQFLYIRNNLVEIFTNKNVNFVPFAISNFRQIGRHDKIENLFFLVDKENLSLNVLNLDTYAGYPTHLIFNQNFKIITGLLENLDRVDDTKVANLLKKEDTADYRATILDAASLMGSVATPEFLDVVTELYSALASDHPSFIKLKEYSFMLPSENFKEIFTEDYLKSLSEEKYTELSKMTSTLLLKIQSSEEIWKRDLEKFMEDYDLNPCVNFRKNGYDGTTLENLNQFKAMYETLIQGGCISIKKEGDTIAMFKEYMVEVAGITSKDANKLISDGSKITLVEGNIQGSVPLGDGSTIFSFVTEQIQANLEYIKSNLDKIKESKASPKSIILSAVKSDDRGVFNPLVH